MIANGSHCHQCAFTVVASLSIVIASAAKQSIAEASFRMERSNPVHAGHSGRRGATIYDVQLHIGNLEVVVRDSPMRDGASEV
jgi:hypothetical protein